MGVDERDAVKRARSRYRHILSYGVNTDRTVFFADAVMAIALTILVLEIRIPQGVDPAHLPRALMDADINGLIGYGIAFALIAVNWLSHHRKFTVIERYDPTLQLLNFGFLFFIALLPLPVSIMAEYGPEPIAVELYAFFIAAPSIFQLLIWVHAWRAKLFSDVVGVGMYRSLRRSLYPVITVFLLSIGVCMLFGPYIGMYSWFMVAPVSIIVGRWSSRIERQVAVAEEEALAA